MNIDTVPLGIEQGENENLYFCTPKGAKIIGWAGVDGIHFCFVRGFGNMVFAISPMNTPGYYVHPLADNFSDFLCLLLACGNTAALEQAHGWSQELFDIFLADNEVTSEQLSVLKNIREKLHLEPMEHPFAYIKQLQAKFDYSKIKFTEDYEDFIPPEPKLSGWKVYFDGSFQGHSGRQRAGKELPTNIHFVWNNKVWHIPAIYTCSKGLVVDFCVQIPIESIRAFLKKWNLSIENAGSDNTYEKQIQIEAEDPMKFNISPELTLNGKTIYSSHGCGLSWNPCLPEQNVIESEGVLKQYGLDPAYGWVIWRSAFPWSTTRKPRISSLSTALKHNPVAISGPHFNVFAPGECINFTHPTTNVGHTLTVQEYQQQEMPTERFGDETYEYPTHYTAMSYTIYPDLLDGSFSIRDYSSGDRPRKKQTNPNEPRGSADCVAIGLIGGADSQTAILFGGNEQGKLRVACSTLNFNPVNTVKWQMVFHEKPCADVTVELI